VEEKVERAVYLV
jgi:hypothetical protein